MNQKYIEQEIWDDFKSLSDSSLAGRLSYGLANAHFGVVYEDKNQLVHNGLNKRLAYDEDYKINQFLLDADHKNIDWKELEKLYPKREAIIFPKSTTYPTPKFRTKRERANISEILLNDWGVRKETLRLKIPNENSAREYLISIRWEDGILCPRCENGNIYFLLGNRQHFKCSKCSLKFSEKVGTIFENTKVGLIKWYEAMYLLTGIKTHKISTPQLAQALGVTQKCSWGMSKKIQSKVKDDYLTKLSTGLFK